MEQYRHVAPRLIAAVQVAIHQQLPLQICHGDVWHEHVLFEGDRVSGLIDFGNLRIDSPCSDIVRLLGSLAGDVSPLWHAGLEAYVQRRRLSPDELALLRLFDETAVLLSGINWLKWILIEKRQFGPWQPVEERLQRIASRLDALARRGS